MTTTPMSRRTFGCAALLGITGPLLVACGGDADEGSGAAPGPEGSSSATASPANGESSGGGTSGPAQGIIAAAEVPVGGGVIVQSRQLVVTQPEEGVFKAFSSVCTHQGQQLGAVSSGRITCPFHGSQFSVEDGSNVAGPNGSEAGSVPSLQEVAVRVAEGRVVEA